MAVVSHRAPTSTAIEFLADVDVRTSNPARIYNYLLGGKDNFPADRAVADAILVAAPQAHAAARSNRDFLGRAVRFLVREAGIRQFLDIGTGIPGEGNVHELAEQVDADVRVVYVDHDPVVYAHANALLAGSRTAAVLADLREPDAILHNPTVRRLIDFEQPVAVL